jgi:hypothetical protein
LLILDQRAADVVERRRLRPHRQAEHPGQKEKDDGKNEGVAVHLAHGEVTPV